VQFTFSYGQTVDTKTLNAERFTIDLPADWQFIKHQGIDSFVGEVANSSVTLIFDYSKMGYSWGIGDGEEQYLAENKWLPDGLFTKKGILYVDPRYYKRLMENKKDREDVFLKHEGLNNDVNKIQVIPNKNDFELKVIKNPYWRPKSDFIGFATYQNVTMSFPFDIPDEYACNKITFKQTFDYNIKLSEPLCEGSGVLGIYFKSRSSNFTFAMRAEKTPTEGEIQLIKQAFETINFVE
tara:strand:- start:17898 stop:18611 length:714 start_codon:yes stop_codon:yes gene_type:complete